MSTTIAPSGIIVGFDMHFDEDVTATGGGATTTGWVGPMNFYREDGDLNGLTMPVDRGMTLRPGFVIRPLCEGPVSTPPVVIESTRSDGTLRIDRIELDDDRYADAVGEWCSGGVRANAASGTMWPDGRREVEVQIGNPGRDAASVRVADDDRWSSVAIEVAGGDTGSLIVRGTPARSTDGTTPVIPLLITIAGATTTVDVPVDF
ncbi:MAG: hypothetical protein R8G01_03890 [Ilumatobacteraceae bacterium]|nr:hypothetical protein [Ilumatobacteraceae bacterium]